MKPVLPEGTVAGLKGANSSVGGCRPWEGSRAAAGEAGVCAGRKPERRTGQYGSEVRDSIAGHRASASGRQALTDGEVMSGGVDMSPKISNWLIF